MRKKAIYNFFLFYHATQSIHRNFSNNMKICIHNRKIACNNSSAKKQDVSVELFSEETPVVEF